jgi:hypothetical protein
MGTDGCCQSLDIDGWIRVGTPFENEVAGVIGCSHIGICRSLPFVDLDISVSIFCRFYTHFLVVNLIQIT